MPDQPVPRRAFLTATAVGVTGAALTPSFPLSKLWRGGQGVRPEPLRLGVASYSLRNFSRGKAIEMVKALGTPYINLKSVHLPYELSPEELATARREIEGAGLHIVGGGDHVRGGYRRGRGEELRIRQGGWHAAD